MGKSPQELKKGHSSGKIKKLTYSKGMFALALLIIVVSTWLVYHNTLEHSFHFDDLHVIQKKDQITDIKNFKDVTYWINPNNRPLSYFTFALNYRKDGLSPKPYHTTNIVIHIISSILIFILLIRIFETDRMRRHRIYPYTYPLAMLAALIFALHPVQTQSVTYITQRMASMAWMFAVASLIFYLHGRVLHSRGKSQAKYLPAYITSLLLWIAAMLSKQNAASLPLICLAAEFIFITNKNRQPYKRFLIAGSGFLLAIVVLTVVAGLIPTEKGALSPLEYFATQMRVILKYMQLSFIPVNLTLDYNFRESTSMFEPAVLLSMLIHIVVVVIAFLLRKREPLIAFGIVLFYLALAVESTIIPIRDVIFEHRMYLSLGGFAIVMSTLFFELFRMTGKRWLYIIPVSYLLILGIGAYDRNKVWKDTCTLWEDTLKKSGGNSRAWLAVGDCYKQKGDLVTAMDYYNRSLELDSANTTALNNRGNLKLSQNDFEGAIADYTTIIAISPESRWLALFNRGIAHLRKGDYLKAIEDFSARIEYTDNIDPQAYFNRALAYVYLGDDNRAIEGFLEVLKLKPSDQDALFNLASVLMNSDRLAEAVTYYTQLLSYYPDHVTGLHYRGVAYLNLGRRADACNDWQKAANKGFDQSLSSLQKYCREVQL